MVVLLVVFEALRLLLRIMLVVLVQHLVRTSLKALALWRSTPPPAPAEWPSVTVQLPMRNEYYVAERIIRVASALEYPRDRLQIQVLDDSDDATRGRVRDLVRTLATDGVPIELVARERPEGYKAGALQEGLRRSRGELVAIFDSDCVPGADFLRRVVPHFHDPQVGLVQVRWSFLNRERSLFTRLQAILLDGVFAVDQPGRSALGAPFQFNGTNGVWRRRCLEEAGGWRGGMLAEDVDMSFRAVLAGWKLVHRPDETVPTEIPETMSSFRSQQRRWARGSAQVLRAMWRDILRSDLPLGSKVMMLLHLGRHAIDPLIFFACLSTPATTLYGMPYLVDYGVLVNAGLLGLLVLAVLVHYGTGIRVARERASNLLLVPLVIPLAVGLSALYTVAFLGGLFSAGGEFVRTPKEGVRSEARAGPVYRSPFDPLALLEIALGVAQVYFAVSAARHGYYVYGGFFVTAAIGFLWVGLASTAALVRRPAIQTVVAPAPDLDPSRPERS